MLKTEKIHQVKHMPQYALYLRASLLCILATTAITLTAFGNNLASSSIANSMNCIAYDPIDFTILCETKAILSQSDKSVTLFIEFKGTALQLDVDYEKEFTDDYGTTIFFYGGNATDGKNTYPARFFLSDDGKTALGA